MKPQTNRKLLWLWMRSLPFHKLFKNQRAVEWLLQKRLPQTNQLFDLRFEETETTEKIKAVKWYARDTIVTLRQIGPSIDQARLEERLQQKLKARSILDDKLEEVEVEVKCIDLSWLTVGQKTFLDFVSMLYHHNHKEILK